MAKAPQEVIVESPAVEPKVAPKPVDFLVEGVKSGTEYTMPSGTVVTNY